MIGQGLIHKKATAYKLLVGVDTMYGISNFL